jgi:hypothetical protein
MIAAFARTAVLSMITGLVVGCATPQEGLDVRRRDKAVAKYPTFGKPIVLEGSHSVVVPFVIQTPVAGSSFNPSSGSSSGGLSAGASYSWSGMGSGSGFVSASNTHWNNLVFHDAEAGTSRLLLDRPAIIVESFFPDAAAGKLDPKVAGIFVVVADADTNRDGFINSADASVLYRCDLSGQQLTRLTPAGTQFQDFVVDVPSQRLYVRVLRDSDANHAFDYKDEMAVLRVDLRHPAEGTPVPLHDVAAQALSIVSPRRGSD